MQISVIEILKAILFGVVEGVTEWLPISSTGHMILLNEFVKLDVSPEFWNLFLVVIQLGAILAVVILYWKTIWPFKKVTLKSGKSKIVLRKSTLMLWLKALVACIPAGVVGVLADDWLDAHLYNAIVVGAALIIVGIAFIIIETVNKNKVPRVDRLRDLTFKDAFIIGLFQLIAAHSGRQVHLYPGDPGHGGREPFKDRQVRLPLLRRRTDPPGHRHAGRIPYIHGHHRIPDELYQKARLQGLWLVQDRPRRAGTSVLSGYEGACLLMKIYEKVDKFR